MNLGIQNCLKYSNFNFHSKQKMNSCPYSSKVYLAPTYSAPFRPLCLP